MKSIKKIKESGKAVAGTALLVGATLAGGAAFATAQSGSSGSGSMTLGDYPAPFVDSEDGTLDTTIVMGEDAKATDVVAAANIAGQLGQDAHTTETETVSVEGSFGWSATNGVSLDTRNDQLFFGDTIDTVRQTLTDQHLDVLETQEVLTGDAEQEVEQYLYVGNQEVRFGTPGDTDGEEDPFLYVNNPSSVEAGNNGAESYLYRLQANFEDGVEFYDANGDSENRNEDVYGQEVTMFGMDFTVADASFQDGNSGQLVLYGSSEEISVDSGQSETVTVGGEEVSIEVVGVTGENTAAVRINGDLEQYSENDEETIGGEDLRVDNIIQTNADNSQGVVQFAIGSEKVVLEDDSEVMIGDDEEDVDGTEVVLSGSNVESGDVGTGTDVELSSVEVAVGADDSDNSYVEAGEPFTDPVFSDVEFHFGGLNPDATEGGDSVGEVDFSTDGDDTATVSFSSGDDDATIPFAYDSSLGNGFATDGMLSDEDGDEIIVQEGALVEEDEYVATDAGDFAHMWEVTSIDRDDTGDSIDSESEATIELEDVVTGATVEVDLDAATTEGSSNGFDESTNNDEYYAGTEVIDGQSYNFVLEGDSDAVNDNEGFSTDGTSDTEFTVTWDSGVTAPSTGTGAAGADSAVDTGNYQSLYTAQDTEFGGAVAFYEPVSVTGAVELPSTDDTAMVTHSGLSSGTPEVFTGGELTYSYGHVPLSTHINPNDGTGDLTFSGATTSGTLHILYADGTEQTRSLSSGSFSNNDILDQTIVGLAFESGDAAIGSGGSVDFDTDTGSTSVSATSANVEADGTVRLIAGDQLETASAAVMEPEDDGDREDTFLLAPGTDTSDDQVEVGGSAATIAYTGDSAGDGAAAPGFNTQTLESDDDVEVSYSTFGTYAERDTDEQGTFTLHVPNGQATAGAAVTGQDGGLEASASGSGTVETMMPTGFPAQSVALDSDGFVDSAQEDSNLVLVGGPAANSLVSDLADMNETWGTSQYTDGEGLVQLVPDAFSEDHHALVVAGYSGEDTRAAGDFLVDYEANSEALAGETQVEIDTESGEVVQ